VEVALDLLKKSPPPTYTKPTYTDFHPRLPKATE